MSKTIGIDLGTTNSCVAVIEGSEPVVIPNAEGSRTTPSVVAFTDDGDRLVGQIARRQAVSNPDNTLFAIKRLIGRRFQDEEVQRMMETMPFDIVETSNGDAWVKIGETQHSPAQISAIILEKMKSTAEEYLGESVTKAIVTVPAHFDDSQRNATKDAGRIAGLDVLRIINEPTAAALAFGGGDGASSTIAVFDLGGGTFDISILELNSGVYEVKSTNGDTFLGGEDFDLRIMDHCLEQFQGETGVDLRQDAMALQRLKEASEKAKKELSTIDETEINLPFITVDEEGPKHLKVALGRAQFEDLVDDLIERLSEPCLDAIADSEVSKAKLDEILLVGGMTRMPRVRQRVEEIFGQPANADINPDEVVAVGAAIQGGVLGGETKDILLLDVTPLTLGIETAGGTFTPLIQRNTTIPCKKGEIFTTAQDNQPFVQVHVLQGERKMSADNKKLATFELTGIPPAPRGLPKIEVIFEIDANGIVNVSAKDLGTGRKQRIVIDGASGLSEREVQEMVREAETYREEDRMRRELADEKTQLDGLLYTTERSLEQFGEQLPFDDLMTIREGITRAQKANETNNLREIRTAHTSLADAARKLAEVLYLEAQAAAMESVDDEAISEEDDSGFSGDWGDDESREEEVADLNPVDDEPLE